MNIKLEVIRLYTEEEKKSNPMFIGEEVLIDTFEDIKNNYEIRLIDEKTKNSVVISREGLKNCYISYDSSYFLNNKDKL